VKTIAIHKFQQVCFFVFVSYLLGFSLIGYILLFHIQKPDAICSIPLENYPPLLIQPPETKNPEASLLQDKSLVNLSL